MDESLDDLLDIEGAAAILGVSVDRVQVMVDDGMLTWEEGGDGPRFLRAELLAARELGG